MQRLRNLSRQSTRGSWQDSRKGSVQFELAMFLPLYAILLMTLLTLCSFARTSQSTVIAARHNAWLQQDLTGTATQPLPTPAASQLGRILHDSQPADGGLLRGAAQRSAMSLVRFLQPGAGSHYEHYVLTDPWDYRVLTFPDRSRHPALQLDRRQSVFGRLDTGAFQQLIPGLSQAAAIANQHLKQTEQQHKSADRRLQQGSRTVTQMLQNEQRNLTSLQQQLHRANTAVPPNPVLIANLQQSIKTAQARVEQLKRQLQLVEQGQGSLHNASL